MQNYKVGPIIVNLEKNNQFIPVQLDFEFAVSFEYLVPSTQEEAERFHRNISRLIKFFQGMNRAYVLETDYIETELFVTGRVANVSIEVPSGCNKMPLFGALLYNKAQALLEEFTIEEFKLGFMIVEAGIDDSESLRSQITYNDMTYLGTTLESLVNYHESLWVDEISPVFEDADGDPLLDPDGKPIDVLPWWKRSDGEVRDLINLSLYEIEDEDTGELVEGIPVRSKEEVMEEIKILRIMIEPEDELADDHTPPPPPQDDDDDNYLSI